MGGPPDAPDFLNEVVVGTTLLGPRSLLEALHAIEEAAGRERPFVNAPRTLDLDLILYGDFVIDEPGLQVPHPRFRDRAVRVAAARRSRRRLGRSGVGAVGQDLPRASLADRIVAGRTLVTSTVLARTLASTTRCGRRLGQVSGRLTSGRRAIVALESAMLRLRRRPSSQSRTLALVLVAPALAADARRTAQTAAADPRAVLRVPHGGRSQAGHVGPPARVLPHGCEDVRPRETGRTRHDAASTGRTSRCSSPRRPTSRGSMSTGS